MVYLYSTHDIIIMTRGIPQHQHTLLSVEYSQVAQYGHYRPTNGALCVCVLWCVLIINMVKNGKISEGKDTIKL